MIVKSPKRAYKIRKQGRRKKRNRSTSAALMVCAYAVIKWGGNFDGNERIGGGGGICADCRLIFLRYRETVAVGRVFGKPQ